MVFEFIQLSWSSLTLEQEQDIAIMFSEKKTGKLKVFRILIMPIKLVTRLVGNRKLEFILYPRSHILKSLLRDMMLKKEEDLYERIIQQLDDTSRDYLEIKI